MIQIEPLPSLTMWCFSTALPGGIIERCGAHGLVDVELC